MPESVSNQVAAGEVVERPFSVIKELMENALDAGANQISVKIQNGGISFIEVIDNGVGMTRNQALLAIERFATSKMSKIEDLDSISTLGFRGEALPSIASVSNFEIITRAKDDFAGTKVFVRGGKLLSVEDFGRDIGTTVRVRGLFFNVPVRKKFLKSIQTERSMIDKLVRVFAILRSDVVFKYFVDGRLFLNFPRSNSLLERVRVLTGSGVAMDLLEIDKTSEDGELKISGFVGAFEQKKSNASYFLTFVNGRYVSDRKILNACRRAYGIEGGYFPFCFLFLTVSGDLVDFNVHPTKKELRFMHPQKVSNFVISAISEVLKSDLTTEENGLENNTIKSSEVDIDDAENNCSPSHTHTPSEQVPFESKSVATELFSKLSKEEIEEEELIFFPKTYSKKYDYIGKYSQMYGLFEGESGLVLLNLRSGVERVLYEKMLDIFEKDKNLLMSQRFLVPSVIEFSYDELEVFREIKRYLQKLGFEISFFGDKSLKVDSVPVFFEGELEDFLSRIFSVKISSVFRDDLAIESSKLSAKFFENEEPQVILSNMLACEMPYCCPRGKATIFQISDNELKRKFS